MVSEVEVTGDQKTVEFLQVQSVEGVVVVDFDFSGSWGRGRLLIGCDALYQLTKSP